MCCSIFFLVDKVGISGRLHGFWPLHHRNKEPAYVPGLGKSTRQNRRGLPICGESASKRTFSLDLTHKRERLSLQCSGTPLSASAASTDVDLKARVRSDVRFCEMSGDTLLNTSIPFYTTPRCVNSRLVSSLTSHRLTYLRRELNRLPWAESTAKDSPIHTTMINLF